MNKRKYNTDPEELLKQCREVMSSEEARYHLRVFAVSMVLSGYSAADMANVIGVSKVAVSGWVKTADEQGLDALRSKEHKGRQFKLSEQQMQELSATLRTSPEEHGFKSWNGSALSSYIKKKYHIELGIRQCQRLLKLLGKGAPQNP